MLVSEILGRAVAQDSEGTREESEGQRQRGGESKVAVGRPLERAAGSRAPRWALGEKWELCELAPTELLPRDTMFLRSVFCQKDQRKFLS